MRACLLPLFVLALAGCGEKAEVQVATEAPPRKSELVSLKVKRFERKDRIEPDRVAKGGDPQGEVDVADGGWQSEKLGRLAGEALYALLNTGSGLVLSGEFEGAELMPSNLDLVPKVEGFESIKVLDRPGDLLGGDAFASSVDLLRKRFIRGSHVKVVGVDVRGDGFDTEVLVAHRGERSEAHARWRCVWDSDGEEMVLRRLVVANYSEATRLAEGMLFEDVAAGVFGDDSRYREQQGHGVAHWAGRITKFGDFALTGHHGIAVADVDGDGREDVFVADGGSLPNRLYRQRADGTAQDVSAAAGVDWYEDSRAALLVDLDNDGDQDLVVATIAMIAFAENDGKGVFTLRGGFPGAQYPFSIAASDYDLDGDLDVYVCLYGEGDQATAARGFASRSPIPFDDAQNGGRNVLLENLGGFGFADVTDEVGLDLNNDRWSFAAAWEDFDRDGDPDLYVANDFGENCFYRNDGGRFQEVARELGVGDRAAGMSVAWGDYNRDAKPDLYVGNMFSSAGGRLVSQPEFASGSETERRATLRRMASGNSLFAGGKDRFVEVPGAAGASAGRWAWSSGFLDVNNDGWEDLAVANGYLTGWAGDGDL